MPKLTVDGIEVEVPDGSTVLQACEAAGSEIPRFCYHDRLSIAGNCRMCLVDMERAPKPVASCAMPAGEGMVISTTSDRVKKARQGVMEFLLINHPLDCPICDQGGECDLQDQAMGYGFDRSRYQENKRAVTDKYMGPLIKTIMTRCIHCTRCVRFSTEVGGVTDLGMLNRGENAEITTYLEKALDSELSANVIDLCPVGALTSRPYAFNARPWELSKTESVDVMDAVGSNIRVDARGAEVLRVLPRLHEDVNEEWIADKTRYACDGLKRQRLDQPYVRKNGKLAPVSWPEALQAAAAALKGPAPEKVAAIAGDLVDAESVMALKDLMGLVGTPHIDCRQDGAKLDGSCRAGYLFNTTIAGIEQADAVVIIGANPRWEAPLVNARIRKRWLRGDLTVGVIGEKLPLTYDYEHLGTTLDELTRLGNGRTNFAKAVKGAERPMLILGMGALTRPDGAAVLAAAREVAEKLGMVKEGWNGFNVLHRAAGRVGALDLGFLPGKGGRDVEGILAGAEKGEIETVFLLGADEIDTSRLGKATVIYQGHHGDAGAHRADIILPGAAYTEKDATYVNTEGRVQHGFAAILPPGDAKEDWKILRALSGGFEKPLPYDTLPQLRRRMIDAAPSFQAIDMAGGAEWADFGTAGDLDEKTPLLTPITNYYMTCPISRASQTMAQCTEVFLRPAAGKTGTDG